MVRRERDYSAEYQRRIALGEARGESRTAARGHRSFADAETAIRRAPAFAPITSTQRQDPKTGRIREVVVYVPDRKGRQVEYRLRAGPGFDRKVRRVGRTITSSDAPYVYGTPTLMQREIERAS